MTSPVREIQTADRSKRQQLLSAKCRIFKHAFDGSVFIERSAQTSRMIWVARLECANCGTVRVDNMIPETCELISRRYFYPEEYQTGLERQDAKILVMKSMMAK